MSAALEVFLNGIAGVFAGMGALYLALKLLARLPEAKSEQPDAADGDGRA